jgi:hypothetical protein
MSKVIWLLIETEFRGPYIIEMTKEAILRVQELAAHVLSIRGMWSVKIDLSTIGGITVYKVGDNEQVLAQFDHKNYTVVSEESSRPKEAFFVSLCVAEVLAGMEEAMVIQFAADGGDDETEEMFTIPNLLEEFERI